MYIKFLFPINKQFSIDSYLDREGHYWVSAKSLPTLSLSSSDHCTALVTFATIGLTHYENLEFMEEVLPFWIPLRMLWIFVLPVRIHFYYFSFVLQENPCSKGSLERHPIGVQGVFASDPTGCLGLTFPSLPSSQLTKSSCKAIFHNYIVDWNPFALQNLKKISEIKHIDKVHFWIEESSHSLD